MAFRWGINLKENERIAQNISNMTQLQKGDLAYDRNLGVRPEWIDKPVRAYTAEIMSEIEEMLNDREPRVESTVEIDDNNNMTVTMQEAEEEEDA